MTANKSLPCGGDSGGLYIALARPTVNLDDWRRPKADLEAVVVHYP